MGWLRRIAVLALALFVVGTLFSFGYNAVTAGAVAPPKGLTFVRTGDFRTRYLEWGTSGTSIVLVHGFVESADTWSAVAQRLSRTHRVYAYDVLGFGYTDRVAPYGMAAETKQLLDFLAAMHLQRPTLVGHSAGAAIIASAALQNPSAVGGLVFLDGDALSIGTGPRGVLSHVIVNPYRTTLFRMAVRSDWLIRTVYSTQCGPACPPLTSAGVQQWRRPLQVAGALEALWAMTQSGGLGLPASEVSRLTGVDVAKLVVFGAGDNLFGGNSAAETAARIGAPAPILIRGARHLSLISHPDQVAAAIAGLAAAVSS